MNYLKKHFFLVIALFFVGLLFAGSFFSQTTKITGTAFLKLGSGEVVKHSGAMIYLIKSSPKVEKELVNLEELADETKALIEKVISQKYKENRSIDYEIAVEEWKKALKEFDNHLIVAGAFFATVANQSARSDVDGKYQFEDLEGSTYYICSVYKSHFNQGYWLIKKEFQKGKQHTIDLSNHNFIDLNSEFHFEKLSEAYPASY